MVFDFLFLPVLLILLAIFSWQDYKTGKINNRYLLVGFLWGAAVLALLALWSLVARPASIFWYEKIAQISGDQARPIFTVSFSYLLKVLINLALTVFLSFAFWRWKIWKAGDAKAVILVSLLLPLKYYQKSALIAFPSAALFLNIFLVALIWILIKKVLFERSLFLKTKAAKEKPSFAKIGTSLKTGSKKKFLIIVISFLAFLGLQIASVRFFPQSALALSFILPLSLLLLNRLLKIKSVFWKKIINPVLSVLGIAAVAFLAINFDFVRPLLLPSALRMLGYFVAMTLVFGLLNKLVDPQGSVKTRFAFIVLLGTLLTIILKGSFFVLWQ